MRFLPIVVVAALALAGCGQKGVLYLRDKPPPGVKPAKPKAYEPVPYPRAPDEEEK